MSVINVHVILLFLTNKPDDDDDDELKNTRVIDENEMARLSWLIMSSDAEYVVVAGLPVRHDNARLTSSQTK